MSVVLELGADASLVGRALEQAGDDGDVVVVDPSAETLEQLEPAAPDPRLWCQIGDAEVVPLPDRFADAALGGNSLDVERALL